MKHRWIAVTCAAVMLASHTTSAGNWAEEQNWPNMAESKQICRSFLHVALPAQGQPADKASTTPDDCDAEDLYYGINQPADPVAAFQCALASREDDPFTGRGLLMTIHANGVGAQRNLEVAIALACVLGGAPAEIDGRVKHLHELLRTQWQGNDFSWCDDITSGLGQALCAQHDARIAQARREDQMATLTEKWEKGPAANLLSQLEKSLNLFIEHRTDNEIEQRGTGHAAMTIGEEDHLKQQFVDDLQGFTDGKPPCAGAERSTDADARLNAVYRKIQKMPIQQFNENVGTITQAGIKRTQLAWLKFRDAWVAFLSATYPAIPRQSVVNWLTLRRVEQLQEFL